MRPSEARQRGKTRGKSPPERRTAVIVPLEFRRGPARKVGGAARPGPQRDEPRTMKRFLLATVVSVAALALPSGQASAGHHHHCYDKCCTFCCKPYNAFSPICCGTLFCDGCCPQFGCQMHQPPGGPGPYAGGGCPDGVCPAGMGPDGICADGSCGGAGGAPWSGPGSLPSAGGSDGQAPPM